MARPNIVWICTDQQRSDGLACAGNPVARTPNVDAIVQKGVRFARHHTPMQLCSPSRATMFTGLLPRHHGLVTNGMALDPSLPTLPSRLAAAGYRTHGVGKLHFQPLLAPKQRRMPDSRAFWSTEEARDWHGPYYGFEAVDLVLGEADTAALAGHYAQWLRAHHPEAAGLLEPAHAIEPPPDDLDEVWTSPIPVHAHYDTWITGRAVHFIDRVSREARSDPFFLFVSYPDPHHPFAPPAEYAKRYRPEEMPPPHIRPGELERAPSYYRELHPVDTGFRQVYWQGRMDLEGGNMIPTDHISDSSIRRAIANTYAMIEMIDDGVGQILEAIRNLHLEDETIVVFTSDHGELLGTHGLLHKGPPPYRQLTEVPMLMKGPGIPARGPIDALTSHNDIVPTMLDMADIDYDSGAFDGMSLQPLLYGNSEGWRQHDFGEYHASARLETYNQTLRTDRWRLTIYPDRHEWGELFDLDVDPAEHHNLYNEPRFFPVKEELAGMLAQEFPPGRESTNEWICCW